MILLIDNYDSFVFNLAHYVQILEHDVQILRNDQLSLETIITSNPSHIIISPGPCSPLEAGISIDVVRKFVGKIPLLGVCLGHQVIGHVFGGDVVRAQQPMHGKPAPLQHSQCGIFSGIPSPVTVGRYHSLIVSDTKLDPQIQVTARSSEGEVMALESLPLRIAGLQFHPESILTEYGLVFIQNFINMFS